jgi:DNA ligase-1
MALLAGLVETSRRIAPTAGRNAKIAELAACLRNLAPAEVAIGAAYLAGETRQGRTGIGYALLRAATPDEAPDAPSLTLGDVDAALARIAATSGAGAKATRTGLLRDLLARATHAERDFLYRLVLGELRQGALESLMIEAVAVAAQVPVHLVREAAMVADGVAAIAPAAFGEGEAGLARYALTLMRPAAPMLAQPASDVAEALRTLGSAAFEWKLDGARVQVHKSGDDVRVFTRNRNDVTASVPEIVDALRRVPARELIVDGEGIALRPNGAPQPFQVTMRRFGRVQDVAAMQAQLPLAVFFFDCLRLGAAALTAAPTEERRAALSEALPEALRMPRIVTADVAAAEAFYDDALRRGHEGVMAKSLTAPYETGKRSASWLKIKRLHTLDLVVVAAEWGHGRRHGYLSNLHLAARDDNGRFVMLGKTFKGMTDEMLAWQTQALLAREIARDGHVVHVTPKLVVEVAFNDLQASPRYAGGLALRFARIRRYRDDKTEADANTMDTVRAIYAGQLARD